MISQYTDLRHPTHPHWLTVSYMWSQCPVLSRTILKHQHFDFRATSTASYKTRNANGETETKRTEQETTPKILILLTVRHGLDCSFKYESPQRLN